MNRRHTSSFNREERVVYTVRPLANVRMQLGSSALKPNTVRANGGDSTPGIELDPM